MHSSYSKHLFIRNTPIYSLFIVFIAVDVDMKTINALYVSLNVLHIVNAVFIMFAASHF